MSSLKILVAGASGLIGSNLFKYFSTNKNFSVFGTIRNRDNLKFFNINHHKSLFCNLNIANYKSWDCTIKKLKPDVVINCIGVTKHLADADNPLITIPVNSYFPHYLNSLCRENGARLIHISTDCVFSGNKGNYFESDIPDALDYYGKSKALGELLNSSAITLRTSTIGSELHSYLGLLDWFLSQKGTCQGFIEAFFSGLTTLELANVISKYVIPNSNLNGLYHIGGKKISKFNLLTIIAKEYDKNIRIIPNRSLKIDRSLDSSRFYEATGYHPPSWPHLIKELRLN